MKTFLLLFLFALSQVSTSFASSEAASPIDAELIRTTFLRMWNNSDPASAQTLMDKLRTTDNYYKGVATCVWEENQKERAREIFFAGIALGIYEQNVGPFKSEYLSFDYLKKKVRWDSYEETFRYPDDTEIKGALHKLRDRRDLIESVRTYNEDSNGGAYMRDTGTDVGPIPRIIVKPIRYAEGLGDVSYLVRIDYTYYCFL